MLGNAMTQNDVAAHFRTMVYCDKAFFWHKRLLHKVIRWLYMDCAML